MRSLDDDGRPYGANVAETDEALAETIQLLTLAPGDDGETWVGESPAWFGDYVFGGFVIAQAIVAATRDAPVGRRLHSLHAYFLRPVIASERMSFRVDALREGRTFTTRHVGALQAGKPVLDMSCSFTADVDGYVYDLGDLGDVARPSALTVSPGPGPWVAAEVGPTAPSADGTRASTHRKWFRVPVALPDDERLHLALLGFATDWTGIGGRPLHLEGDTQGMVSLDHSAWFHRPARVDEWLFYDVHSLVNAGGRGLLRGTMRDLDGRVIVSVAQEMRLTPVESSG
jgi:acyl-CoA thioesterase II